MFKKKEYKITIQDLLEIINDYTKSLSNEDFNNLLDALKTMRKAYKTAIPNFGEDDKIDLIEKDLEDIEGR